MLIKTGAGSNDDNASKKEVSAVTEVIVCGGRDFNDEDFLFRALDAYYMMGLFNQVVQGGASGADALAQEWAISRHVPSVQVPADWKLYGKRAGPIRNRVMANRNFVKYVIAFTGSSGTANMIIEAEKRGHIVIDLRGKEKWDLKSDLDLTRRR